MKNTLILAYIFLYLCYFFTWLQVYCLVSFHFHLKDSLAFPIGHIQRHQLNEHAFEQTPRNTEGQGSLTCHSPQGHNESDKTQKLDKQDMSTSDEFPQHLLIWECLNFFIIECQFCQVQSYGLSLSLRALNMSSHYLLTSMVSAKMSNLFLNDSPLYRTVISLLLLSRFFLCL